MYIIVFLLNHISGTEGKGIFSGGIKLALSPIHSCQPDPKLPQKNSYGPENRIAEWDLINDGYQDNANFMDRPIRFDRWVCEWLLDKGYFSTKCNMKRYSSDIIGVTGAPSSEYYEAILNEDNYPHFVELCKSCNIAGY